MDLIDRLKELAARAPKMLDSLDTEEATKNALVMPFIIALGYNVFNPDEVIPEFTADIGVKKGEKVDYGIMQNGQPIMLFECKAAYVDLDEEHISQLYRYFSNTPANFGILTNGIHYRVFSDLDDENKMDKQPFLEFSILEISDGVSAQIKQFSKDSFDHESIRATAKHLKYARAIKHRIIEEWTNPSDEFVRALASEVYKGHLTQSVRKQFSSIIKTSFQSFVNDRIKERFQTALGVGSGSTDTTSLTVEETDTVQVQAGKTLTTADEVEAYYIVKSIVREAVDPQRVFIRDVQSYCSVLLDDKNYRPICRLYFNSSKKYVGILDAEKNVTKHPISNLNEIYKLARELRETATRYDAPSD